jgi:hypothetical protein
LDGTDWGCGDDDHHGCDVNEPLAARGIAAVAQQLRHISTPQEGGKSFQA